MPFYIFNFLCSSSMTPLSRRSNKIDTSGNKYPDETYCGTHWQAIPSQSNIFSDEKGKNGARITDKFAMICVQLNRVFLQ